PRLAVPGGNAVRGLAADRMEVPGHDKGRTGSEVKGPEVVDMSAGTESTADLVPRRTVPACEAPDRLVSYLAEPARGVQRRPLPVIKDTNAHVVVHVERFADLFPQRSVPSEDALAKVAEERGIRRRPCSVVEDQQVVHHRPAARR